MHEGAIASRARGRHPTLLGLNEDLLVIAVDVHLKKPTAAMVDRNGRLLPRSLVPINATPTASTRLIIHCIQRMRDKFFRKIYRRDQRKFLWPILIVHIASRPGRFSLDNLRGTSESFIRGENAVGIQEFHPL